MAGCSAAAGNRMCHPTAGPAHLCQGCSPAWVVNDLCDNAPDVAIPLCCVERPVPCGALARPVVGREDAPAPLTLGANDTTHLHRCPKRVTSGPCSLCTAVLGAMAPQVTSHQPRLQHVAVAARHRVLRYLHSPAFAAPQGLRRHHCTSMSVGCLATHLTGPAYNSLSSDLHQSQAAGQA